MTRHLHLLATAALCSAVAPILTAVAKPAAVYELKDQDSFNFLLRAQRNF